jgi:predicted nucleic acid-binding protein
MKTYLLDTGVLVALLKGRSGAVRLIRPWILRQEVATSVPVYGEAIEHLRGDPNYSQRQAELRILLRSVTPYPLTYKILERYATLRRAMRPPFGPGLIGDIDTLIAATALERRLTLVTIDGDFTRVPDLSLMHLERSALK